MERETALAQKLQRVGFDLTRLTESQRTEIYDLARAARIELWRPGLVWASSPDAGDAGVVTIFEPRP